MILTSCSNVSARVNWVKANEWRKSPVLLSATRIRTSARFFDILPAIKKGEDSYEAWFGLNQSTFGGFLFHRSALLRRISAGFTSGLPGPRSCDKRTLHQNLRLISPFSRTEPYGASGKHSQSGVVYQVGRKASAFFGPRIEGPSFFSFPTALCSSVRTTYGRAAQK